MTVTYNFVSLIVKLTLFELASALSSPNADKKKIIRRITFQLTLQLINSISNDLQKLLRYFNSTATVMLFKIRFASSVILFLVILNIKFCVFDSKNKISRTN